MGIISNIKLWAARRRFNPERESLAYPKLVGLMGQNRTLGTPKPTPTNLRYFSRTVYARRAINTIKNPIAKLDWEIVLYGVKGKSAERQAEAISMCLARPNNGDSWRSLVEQFVEDAMVNGAGVLEQAQSSDEKRPIWLWPVDSTTIRPVVKWDGNPKSIRFLQANGYTGGSILSDLNAAKLKAEDIVYMRMNPSTESPYGYGPLEIAYDSISRQLGVGRYAAAVASNAQPANMLFLGEATNEQVLTFRNYWRNEVEGQGQTPILGNKTKAEVFKLHSGGDEALYLKWQEFLIREIATAFDISPQNLSIERDVNRNTSEVAEDRDWDQAIIPMATLIEQHINQDVIHGRLGIPYLKFQFVGLDREDEEANCNILTKYYQNNVLTPAQICEKLGWKPPDSEWSNMTYADIQIAIKAAQGAKQVDDPELFQQNGGNNAAA